MAPSRPQTPKPKNKAKTSASAGVSKKSAPKSRAAAKTGAAVKAKAPSAQKAELLHHDWICIRRMDEAPEWHKTASYVPSPRAVNLEPRARVKNNIINTHEKLNYPHGIRVAHGWETTPNMTCLAPYTQFKTKKDLASFCDVVGKHNPLGFCGPLQSSLGWLGSG